ncbi:FAD-binding oxidoreductase [Phormidium sp. CLA17]|uniref:FAD-binding oxidoreductase n=1 Tax=Leptolyngbya sp. Cla-17 TaxID=2803751 RepID=UPI001491BEBA|nr:FAD-binding oxidoreductase [Leptolyngbya sp. Cla-17]MBM0741892.1 FAD-binding oxidoreductase [Leptolyngbya sp. Cla-17]
MNTNPTQNDAAAIQAIAQELEQITGAEHLQVWDKIESLCQARIAQAAPSCKIACLLFPQTAAELADIVTCAHQNQWGMILAGSGSKLHWGGLIQSSPLTAHRSPLIAISTQRLNQLIDHAAGDLTVTVEAGMRFAELQALLAKANQFLAIDPSYPQQATIGGIVATADTGSFRQRYQGVRDMLLGISFVRADGNMAKAGGRVVKNVAGYDLMKLFTGSYGTLGMITQVTLRVYPLPEVSQTVILSGDSDAIAEATRVLLSSALTPAHADVISGSVMETLGLSLGMGLVVRFQSILPSVQEQMSRFAEVGRSLKLASASYTDGEDTQLWEQLQKHMTASPQSEQIICKIGIQPSSAISLLHELHQLSLSSWSAQIHSASGLGRFICPSDVSLSHLLKIREICQTNGGFLSILQAPTVLKQQIEVWGYAGNALSVMRSLKQQFDPHNLLNPGRFVGGI